MRDLRPRNGGVGIAPPVDVMIMPPPKPTWGRRLTLMMRQTELVTIVIVLMLFGFSAVAYYFATLPSQLRIAVGPPNSDDARVIQALGYQFARERAAIRLRVTVMPGAREAAAAVERGDVDLAVVRRDAGMPKEAQAVAIMRRNVVTLMVPPPEPEPATATAKPAAANPAAAAVPATATGDDPAEPKKRDAIETVEHLVGKRIGIVGRSPANVDLLRTVLRHYNITPARIEMLGPESKNAPREAGRIGVVQLDTDNVSAGIRDIRLDAIVAIGPVSSPITGEAIAAVTRDRTPPTFVAIAAAEAIAQRNPAYESTEIKAGAFGGSPPLPQEAVNTIGFNHFIVANRKLSDGTVAEFARLLFTMRPAIAVDVPSAINIALPNTERGASVPVHPGAAAYADGEVKSLFDRYTEWLYWGLLLVSLFGSGLAGLIGYRRSDVRAQQIRVIESLFQLIPAARIAGDPERLDALTAEADAILRETIPLIEIGELDASTVSAFSMTLDQVRQAIAERRAALHVREPPLHAAAAE